MTTIRSSKGVKKFSQFIVFLEAAVDLVFDFATCEDFKPADFEAEEAGGCKSGRKSFVRDLCRNENGFERPRSFDASRRRHHGRS